MADILTSFRLVEHQGAPEGDHLDLFLRPDPEDDNSLLPVFELPIDFVRSIRRGDGPIESLRLVVNPNSGAVAVRKADHRPVYWEYAGPISAGRGSIREVARGTLVGDWNKTEIRIECED